MICHFWKIYHFSYSKYIYPKSTSLLILLKISVDVIPFTNGEVCSGDHVAPASCVCALQWWGSLEVFCLLKMLFLSTFTDHGDPLVGLAIPAYHTGWGTSIFCTSRGTPGCRFICKLWVQTWGDLLSFHKQAKTFLFRRALPQWLSGILKWILVP